ncbi:MAG: hypothetical protein ACOYOE_01785 [Chlorobium sp.]
MIHGIALHRTKIFSIQIARKRSTAFASMHPTHHGALEYKSANVKPACAFPGDRQFRFASLPVTSPMRKQREELWAPPPPEYRKLLRLKA